MRPAHIILDLVRPTLWNPETCRRGPRRICFAIIDARDRGEITDEECELAEDAVMEAVAKLGGPGTAMLCNAAIKAGHLPPYTELHDPGYIKYRDQWLDNLILELEMKHGAANV